jgi:hypothetical protein
VDFTSRVRLSMAVSTYVLGIIALPFKWGAVVLL